MGCCCNVHVLGAQAVAESSPYYSGYQDTGGAGIQYTAVQDWHDLIGLGRPLDAWVDAAESGVNRNAGADFTFAEAGRYMWVLNAMWNSLGGRITVRLVGSVGGVLEWQTSGTVTGQRGWVLFGQSIPVQAGEIVTIEYCTTVLSAIYADGSMGPVGDVLADRNAQLSIFRIGPLV